MKKSSGHQIRTTLVVIALLAIAGAVGYWAYTSNRPSASQPKDDWVDGVNYRPPSDEEIEAGKQIKQESVQEKDEQNNANNAPQKTVSVIITDASQYGDIIEVRAFIPDHYANGTCTITFTKDSHVITKSTPAYKDISTTICTNPVFNKTEFPAKGQWSVIVKYSSDTAKGQSEPQVIEIT